METEEKKALLAHFADLEDPRTRESMHRLEEILRVAVCAVLSGADGWVGVALWGRAQLPWLRQCLPFENGTASHDTCGRGFALLDAVVFERCFVAWMASVCGAFQGVEVSIDGKTARRSQSTGRHALHWVSAVARGLGLTLGQVRTAEQSNEITAIPELLDALLRKGCIVTIDAMGCQKTIAAKSVEKESDSGLAVKNNPPTLAQAIERFFDGAERREWQGVPHTFAAWVEKDHGRIETRRCRVIDDLGGLGESHGWPQAKTLAVVEAVREINGVASVEPRYDISSLQTDAERLGTVVREHWGVENSLHWVLDVAYGEDQARMREGNSAEHFSILRRITLNLIRQDHSVKGQGRRQKPPTAGRVGRRL